MDSYRFYLGARAYYAVCWTCMVTINMVFMVEVAGLDPLQMVLVGTALEFSAFVFEIPTGIFADTVSRKWSVVIGHALTGIAFVVLAMFPRFDVIILTQILWGFGWTFISGAYPAWLTEEIGVERANRALLRATQVSQVTAFFGIGAGIALAQVSLQLPIAVGGCAVLLLAVAMSSMMRETGFEPAGPSLRSGEHNAWQALTHTFRQGVGELRLQPVLITIMLVGVVIGMFSEGFDRLYTPYLIETFTFPALGALDTVVWWGVISAVSLVMGLIATTLAQRWVDTESHRQLTISLAALTLGIAVSVVAFANLPYFYGVLACFWVANGMRAAMGPLSTAWLNRRIPAHARATLLSMQGQADSVGQAMAGPVVGVIAKYVSIATALTVSGLVLIPSMWLYRRVTGADDS